MEHKKQIPSFLYHAFSKQEYASDFIARGLFLMRLPEYYRKIEDTKRKDSTEGIGRFKTGNTEHETLNLNCKYLLCCSGPEVDLNLLKCKFGAYIVKINDPLHFAQDVTSWLHNERIPLMWDAAWKKVCYNKDQALLEKFSKEQYAEFGYIQKDPKFSDEYEYRLIVITEHNSVPRSGNPRGSKLQINIGQRLGYADHVLTGRVCNFQ